MEATKDELLGLAVALARVKHAGQFRKVTGEPYFEHVRRVGARASVAARALDLDSDRAWITGLLHDLVEDTVLSPLELRHVGFGWDIVDDVVGLSRNKTETYSEFIVRGTKDLSDEGLLVKWADLQDNLTDEYAEARPGLRARYIQADAMVRAALKKRGHDLSQLR